MGEMADYYLDSDWGEYCIYGHPDYGVSGEPQMLSPSVEVIDWRKTAIKVKGPRVGVVWIPMNQIEPWAADALTTESKPGDIGPLWVTQWFSDEFRRVREERQRG